MLRKPIVRLLCVCPLLVACRAAAPPSAAEPKTPATTQPAAPPPSRAGVVDEGALDRSVDPCDDFYQFACGGWLKSTPIPPDRAQWTRSFSEITERNLNLLRAILEKDAAGNGEAPYAQKLGDFYATCMDEKKAETASLADLKERLASIDKVKDGKALARTLGELQLDGVGALFEFGQQQDFKDATQVIGVADQGGLGLPDRDYYTSVDPKSVELRKDYLVHVGKMLELVGQKPKEAEAAARKIVDLETRLAKVSLRRVERRDPNRIYHRLERTGLSQKTPRLAWDEFFSALGKPTLQPINVAVPEFFAGLNEVLQKNPPLQLRQYLKWQLVHSHARALGTRFVDEDFRFMVKRLTGAEQLKPRWKRCVEATDAALGFALAQEFVKEHFGEEGKTRSREILDRIETAFRQDVIALPWMDDGTRGQALDKLGRIVNKIGYPEVWRNYDKLAIDRSSSLANLVRANEFESHRQLDKIGKPVDRSEWEMTPPTVNAYYEPSLNEMVFPAGILQPPFFNRESGDPTNYGGIGMVIGHELTHGFDDEGRKFDGLGNLREWWAPEVGKKFEERAECVARQYSGYVPVDDLHLDGHLTLGENIADLGGIKLAHAALQASRSTRGPAAAAAGFNEEQQFFLGYAQAWCTNRKDEEARRRVTMDPHSPPKYRVNGVVVNSNEFQEAFRCKPGAKMAPTDRCQVW